MRQLGAGLIACGVLAVAWSGRGFLIAVDGGAGIAVTGEWGLILGGAVAGTAIGVGLWRLVPAARVPGVLLAVVLCVVGLLKATGAGLLAGYAAYLLYSQTGRSVLSEAYQELIFDTPHMRAKPVEPAWILLILIATGIAIAILARPSW